MKTLKTTTLFILFITISQFSFGQEKTPRYKDIVSENPNAETTIQVVSDYLNALINNKMDKAASLLSEKYMEYGPGTNDSINKTDQMAGWKESHLARSNEKVSFVSQTFRVTQGNLKGDWVSQWGTYVFTQDGKTISLPYQVTSRVANGKIEMSRIYFDNLAIVTALGYTLTPPAKK